MAQFPFRVSATRTRSYAFRIAGPMACFTRPEFRSDRMSYDIMTPSAANGMLDAFFFKPMQFEWRIEQIHMLAPIQHESRTTSEVPKRADGINPIDVSDPKNRKQVRGLYLRDVDYLVVAHAAVLAGHQDSENRRKYEEMIERRASRGSYSQPPALGLASFFAETFEILTPEQAHALTPVPENRVIGAMLYGFDYSPERETDKKKQGLRVPYFFNAEIRNGVLRGIDAPNNTDLIDVEVWRT